jgi:hypothetical protein
MGGLWSCISGDYDTASHPAPQAGTPARRFLSGDFLQQRLHFPANLREWERQPFFLTLIAKKWLPQPQLVIHEGLYEAVGLDF